MKRLIATQFSKWSGLDIKPVEVGGWDNRTFHFGNTMMVRLPSSSVYASQVEKEQRWLPQFKSQLPLQIPTPLAMGSPNEEYPWHWSIYQWIEGYTASLDRISDLTQFALTLADFLHAFQKIDTTNGLIAGAHNFYRGGDLSVYDTETRQKIIELKDFINTNMATEIWEKALQSQWTYPPVWVHGDIAVGNLLVNKEGALIAVIDFGCLAIGDPACDLVIVWTLLQGESREVFRSTLNWDRARGWALWKALLVYSEALKKDNAIQIQNAKRILDQIMFAETVF